MPPVSRPPEHRRPSRTHTRAIEIENTGTFDWLGGIGHRLAPGRIKHRHSGDGQHQAWLTTSYPARAGDAR